MLLSEKLAVEARLDPGAVDLQVAAEVEAARRAAEAQARIEVEALQQRLRWVGGHWGGACLAGHHAAVEAAHLLESGGCGVASQLPSSFSLQACVSACQMPQETHPRPPYLPHLPSLSSLPACRSMEAYVEEGDAKRLAAASRVGELEAALAGVKRGEEDSYDQVGVGARGRLGMVQEGCSCACATNVDGTGLWLQLPCWAPRFPHPGGPLSAVHVLSAITAAPLRPLQVRAAEERAEGVALELQYAQGEAAGAAQELALVRDQAERRARWVGGWGWGRVGGMWREAALEPPCLLLIIALWMARRLVTVR